jgi:hypothetical protein
MRITAMGEIADMMLDGTLDCETGEYIGDTNKRIFGDEAPGFPISYETDSDYNPDRYLHHGATKVACPHCHRRVKPEGLADHIAAKHPEEL